MKRHRFLFLATVFSVTFEKVHWEVAGQVSLADLLAIGFIISFCADRIARGDARLPRTSFVAIAFLVVFLVVYLVGFFNLDTATAAAQYAKGMTKFTIHFLFLITGVAYLARCARTFYWQAFGVFTAGMVFNAAYGLLSCSRPVGRQHRQGRCSRRSRAARARSTSTARSRGRTSTARTRSRATPTTSA